MAYNACLSCHVALGTNRSLEQLPIGRRVAFDSERGRLWVICWRCGTWNLTPFETRWEAIEQCERAYRSTPQRYSTENIGLAQLPGLQLVRIGRPTGPEFAAWRYGHRFARRRKQLQWQASAGVVGAGMLALGTGALMTAGAGVGLVASSYAVISAWLWRRKDPYVARIPSTIQAAFPLRRWDLRFLRITRQQPGWGLDTQKDREFTGAKAVVGLSLVLPLINRWGGSPTDRSDALRLLSDAGGPEKFIEKLPQRHLETIALFSRPERLALEMAINEHVEHELLEHELWLLEAAWREAEAVAAIADSLLVPPGIDARIARWRGER